MIALSLYSGGCDGLSLAASWVGIETAGFCECDEACREQLHRRHPGKPVFRYDTEVTRDALQDNGIDPHGIDIILASPPCQCASLAGKRLGAADQRNRWPQCLRILRDVRPRWFLGENVPGLLSVDGGRLFASILGEMAEMGYGKMVRVWRCRRRRAAPKGPALYRGPQSERRTVITAGRTSGTVRERRDYRVR